MSNTPDLDRAREAVRELGRTLNALPGPLFLLSDEQFNAIAQWVLHQRAFSLRERSADLRRQAGEVKK